jgi:NADPH:quinone reductase
MRAVLCNEFGPIESLVLTEVEPPVLKAGYVLIETRACAVSFPDVLMVQGLYQYKPPFPFAPGTELSGVVLAVGDGVEDVAVGDRVLANIGYGGLAAQVAVPAQLCIRFADDVGFVEASAFLSAYGTSYHALHDRGHLQPGETLLVLGAAGGVGLAAVELGAAHGATVIAAASTPEKLEMCRLHGASMTINYSAEDLKERVKDLTDGRGADVVYDAVGGPYSEPALRATAWEGRFLVVGFAAGDVPRIPLNLALLKGCAIVGVFWGAAISRDPQAHLRNVDALMTMWRDGRIHPHVSAVHPLEESVQAIRDVADRKATGRIVVTFD